MSGSAALFFRAWGSTIAIQNEFRRNDDVE